MPSRRDRVSLAERTGVLPALTTCRGPRTELAGVEGQDLADDEPVEEHPERREVLLDGRGRARPGEFLYVGRDHHRLDLGKGEASVLAPLGEAADGREVRVAGVRVDARLARFDLALQQVVAGQRLLQGEQVFVAPVAPQAGRNGGLVRLATTVPELRQRRPVPLARDDGAHDQLPGLAHDVAQHVVQLDVHLRQRLLQVLHCAAAVTQGGRRAHARDDAAAASIIAVAEGMRRARAPETGPLRAVIV